MSYSINVDDISKKFFNEEWTNLTWEAIIKNNGVLKEIYEEYYYNNIDDEYKKLKNKDKIKYILQSEELSQISDDYYPMTNFVHILQNKPNKEEILKIVKNAPSITIIKDEYDNFFMGLSGTGTDLSDQLAYAYMLIDKHIPKFLKQPVNNSTLNKKSYNKLLKFS